MTRAHRCLSALLEMHNAEFVIKNVARLRRASERARIAGLMRAHAHERRHETSRGKRQTRAREEAEFMNSESEWIAKIAVSNSIASVILFISRVSLSLLVTFICRVFNST